MSAFGALRSPAIPGASTAHRRRPDWSGRGPERGVVYIAAVGGSRLSLGPTGLNPVTRGSAMKISVSTVVAAPVTEVWRAYNSPEDIRIWNTASPDWHTTASTVDLRVGGTFSSRMEAKDGSFGFDFAGEYTKIVPLKLLEYTFGGRVGTVEFAEGPSGVTVKVTFDSESTHSEEQQRAGWQAILDNFARHVVARHANKSP